MRVSKTPCGRKLWTRHVVGVCLGWSVTLGFVQACRAVEESSYNAGSRDSGGQQGRSDDASRGPTSPARTPAPNAVKEVDAPPLPEESEVAFDTGLPQCVQDAFKASSTPLFVPRKLEKMLESFQGLSALASKNDLWMLYDLLLREVVTPNDGLVAYSRLRFGGDLAGAWALFVKSLAEADLPVALGETEKITFWLNTYNALMIDILVRTPDALGSSKRSATFRTPNLKVAGQNISLDAIEYGVLGLNGRRITASLPAEAMPTFVETRLHFALVCGAKSCPRLRNFAYVPSQLGTALNENAHRFFNDDKKHVVFLPDEGTPKLSACGFIPLFVASLQKGCGFPAGVF